MNRLPESFLESQRFEGYGDPSSDVVLWRLLVFSQRSMVVHYLDDEVDASGSATVDMQPPKKRTTRR